MNDNKGELSKFVCQEQHLEKLYKGACIEIMKTLPIPAFFYLFNILSFSFP